MVFLYKKRGSFLAVFEQGERARISGLNGWLDSVDLDSLLRGNGYVFAGVKPKDILILDK